ncbi:MAG: macro domain-containing protein [Polyangiaceae bacterium]|nr:macro domain-containing protein [Polyangiaceae bacterium]
MPLPSLILADHWAPLTRAWSEAFAPFEAVHVHDGDFFALDADAMVSPANSFGIMDGGLDAAIRAELGGHVQTDVQARILERHHGELPVGAAEIVPTHHARWPFLVVAPTMRVPESVAHTLNAYLSFRAALLAVLRHNAANPAAQIRSMVVPGLGTGIGAMDARRCAAQMRIAFDHVSKPPRIPSFRMIHDLHQRLRSAL